MSNNVGMALEETLLLLFTIAFVIGGPLYIFLREKMTKKPLAQRKHTSRRIIKLTAINLVLNLSVALYFSFFLFLILQRPGIQYSLQLYCEMLLYLIIIWVTFYGNGIYITTIMLEDFTLPELRDTRSYKTQYIATRLFHGPISHILIFSGWILVFLILAVLDVSLQVPNGTTNWQVLLMAGSITGFFVAFSNIANGTAVYQFFTGSIVVTILTFIISSNEITIATAPIMTYYVGLMVVFELCVGSYLAYLTYLKKKKGRHIIWDHSGGPGILKPDHKLLDLILRKSRG